MNDLLTILQGDWIERLRELADESIDLCVTSPPYDRLRDYDGCKWSLPGGPEELFRVLRAGGLVCWNVGCETVDGCESLSPFKQAIYFVEECGFNLHDTMAYVRLNFSAPEQTRYHQAFEYIFVFSKGRPGSFNPIRDRKNIYGGQTAWGKNTKRQADGSISPKKSHVYAEWGMRTNVWTGNTRGQEEPCKDQPHPAPMPKWLARDLILSWSNQGDTIIDPFAGSGTTGQVALELGRKAVLIELNPKYIELIKQRTFVTPGLALA